MSDERVAAESAGSYKLRLADPHLDELLAEFPAVMITGPRAAGKTTTAANRANQIDRLDQPDVAAAYRADPDAALRRAARPVLVDEWQEVPEVLGAVKRVVDQDRTPGQILLTGSVRAALNVETWAGTGRVVRLNMYPLTQRELQVGNNLVGPPFLERLATSGLNDIKLPDDLPDIDGYIRLALRSGFPELALTGRSDRAQGIWLSSYLDDLITRDAAFVDPRKDPAKLRRYVEVLALHNAGLPTDAALHRVADIDAKTAAGYDRLLQDLFFLDLVPAWGNNRLSRLTKTAKRYLIDSGLAAAAIRTSEKAILADSDLVGRFFDSFATSQLRPEAALTEPRMTLSHLRVDAGRHEVDLIAEIDHQRIVAFEFKAGSAPNMSDAKHLRWLRDELGERLCAAAVLHTGRHLYELGERLYAIPLAAIWA